MGWDVKLTRADGMPLGSVDAVQKAIIAVLPETRFYVEPGGAEKIAAFKSRRVELPDAIESMFAKMSPTIKGDYGAESDGLLIQFHLGAGGDVNLLHVTVKGDNDAAEAFLTRMATASGWLLSNYSPGDGDVN